MITTASHMTRAENAVPSGSTGHSSGFQSLSTYVYLIASWTGSHRDRGHFYRDSEGNIVLHIIIVNFQDLVASFKKYISHSDQSDT